MPDSYETHKTPIPLTQEFFETCRKEIVPVSWKTQMTTTVSKTYNYTTDVFRHILPVVHLIRNYELKSFLANDIIGGLTVSFMQLPQGMAYAIVADLPVEVGLFMGFFPVICYSIFGSSKHLSFGAIIVISLMFGNLMETHFSKAENILEQTNQSVLFNDNLLSNNTVFLTEELLSREKIKLAAAITLITGLTQCIMGILRFGFLMKFLSSTIISAFSAGIGFYVTVSQLKNILGISINRYSGFLSLPRTLYAIILQLPNLHYPVLLLSLITIFIIYIIKSQINERFKYRLRIPVPIDLIMVILMIPISYGLQLGEKYNFKVVGYVPRGLPTPFVPDISLAKDYITDGVSIGLIAFVYSISVALIFSQKEGYDIDANQELLAYGMTNIVTSFFGCFTASGAVSRTSVQVGCGAKSQVSGLVGALFMLIVIFVAGPWLKPLPICVLSCIIIVALRTMLKEVFTLPKVWRVCKYDGVIWIVTFVAVIFTSVGIGLLIGIVFGIISVVVRTLWVEAISLGIINNTKVFLDQNKYEGMTLPAGIKVVSFSSPLYYANVDIFRNEIDSKTENFKKINEAPDNSDDQEVQTDVPFIINPKSADSLHEDKSHQKIIIECSGISFIDRMGATALQQLYVDYKKKGISCFFSGVNDRVISTLKASGMFETLQHVMYLTSYDAMVAAGSEDEISIQL